MVLRLIGPALPDRACLLEPRARGVPGQRVSGAASVRHRLVSSWSVGELGEVRAVTRQAAREAATNPERRGLATIVGDPDDARRLGVSLTEAGRALWVAIVEVIASLNRAVAGRVAPGQLRAEDAVLLGVIHDEALGTWAQGIPSPRTTKSGSRDPHGPGAVWMRERGRPGGHRVMDGISWRSRTRAPVCSTAAR